mgnify:CR=1 FL=1
MSEKLQKVLARTGLGSRRQAETWIQDGRVSVDGETATLGDRVEGNEEIRLDNKRVPVRPEEDIERRVILYHKNVGEVSSRNDPENRPTVFDHLPRLRGARWVQVGRLDINTSGLMLFTTDGELAHRLMHPSNEFVREYAVRVRGEITEDKREALLKGVELEDGVSSFRSVEDAGGSEEGANHWYKVTLIGGKYREVRRLLESQDLDVSRLIRTRFGDVELPSNLRRGRWMDMPPEQVQQLVSRVELKSKHYTGLYGRARLKHQKGNRGGPPRKPRRGPYRK